MKDEKKGLVPALRFPEFREAGEWTTRKLEQVAELLTEKAGNRKFTLMSVTAGIGLVSQLEKFGREIAGAQYKNYFVIRNNDFAYNKSATKDYPEGFVALYEGDAQAAVPNSIFTCFRVETDEVIPRFLNYQFMNNLHGRWLRKFITIGARAHGSLNIDNKDLLALPVPMPMVDSAIQEQQKIADCLSSLDALIAAQADKIDALKTHKKGLMQQLFPREGETVPRLRFPEFRNAGEWEEIALGQIVDIRSGYSPSRYNLLDEAQHPFLKVEDLNNCEKYQTRSREYSDDSLGVVPARSIIFPKRGAAILNNKIRLNTLAVLMDTNLMAITPRKNVLAEFLYCIVVNEGLSKIADTSTIPQINNKHITPYVVRIPDKVEQQAISDCLSSLDTLITAHTEKLEALKSHKKGLMQQLFPSPEVVST